MVTVEERLSRLEGGSVATKADLKDLEMRLTGQMGELEIRMTSQMGSSESRLIRWMVGMVFGGMVASAAIATAVAKLLG